MAHAAPMPRLAVPRSDWRQGPGSRRKTRSGSALLIAMGFAGAVAVAGLALASDMLAELDVRGAVSEKVRAIAVATGFGIDQVSITGQRHAADTEIFDALDLDNVRTFADLDMKAALKRIERISWIDTAQITRSFPSALIVTVQERMPSAIWSRGGSDYLVDGTGRVLGPAPAQVEWRLPRIAGEGAASEAPFLMAALSRHPEIAREMAVAERVGERRWRVALHSGSMIELGADREAEGLDRVVALPGLAKALSERAMIVDVRTAGRVALRAAPARERP